MKLLQKKAPLDPLLSDGVGTGNPYVDAQNVWHERYGTYLAQAYNWRLVAVLEAIALVAAIVGLIYLASQTKFVPYVVAIDKVGMAFAVQPAERASSIDERVVHAQLAQWVEMARSVVTDREVEVSNLDRVYGMVEPNSPARAFLDDYYPNGHDPLQRAFKETDTVTINAILPVSSSTYEIQWTETLRNAQGRSMGQQIWDGTFSIAVSAPNDEATILKNPLGIYLTDIHWQQKL
jgi:type IV secretion system protein VirB5